MTTKIKIPWQGVMLGLIGIVLGLVAIVGTVLGLDVILRAFIISQNAKIAVLYLNNFIGLIVASYVLVILACLMVVGYFSGKKIAVIIGLFTIISNLLLSIFIGGYNSEIIVYKIIGFFVMGGYAWVHIICLKHPYYGGNGKISLDTFKFWKKRAVRTDEMSTF